MATDAKRAPVRFDPTSFSAFRFLQRTLDARGYVTLRYALDEEVHFVEEFELPLAGELGEGDIARVDGLLALLHWVAGVSYFKTALPPRVVCEAGVPGPATVLLLEALYSEGLGELAYTNGLAGLPRPEFPRGHGGVDGRAGEGWKAGAGADEELGRDADEESGVARPINRLLVPVGGGKDSAVAIEIARRAVGEVALFSIGDAAPIARTVAVAGLPHLLVRRRLDPGMAALNAAGAINGHVPITAIVSCVALLVAALHNFNAVAMANERSASHGNVSWDGVEVNHQFSKGLRAERLLSAAIAEIRPGPGIVRGREIPPMPRVFSILRPASELAIARAFARLQRYHGAFTSCNAIFRLDPALRASSWCCDCPKCRFVFLALAPFSTPAHLSGVFGRDLLQDESQFEGFALLTATGGHKPFECVGEEQESLAAIRLLAHDRRWSAHSVVRRLVEEVLPRFAPGEGDPDRVLALGDEHRVPPALMADVSALLGA
jgi:UDP-N-acetyl-alpha-D-muramoyl-L-alanyl-L-glutamate epimerase